MKFKLVHLPLSILILFVLYQQIATLKTLMLVNFIRHGNRTPGKIQDEIKHYFHKMDLKKLTLNGFQQMNILGKYYRKKYIDTGIVKLDLNKITHEFLIISSPSSRSIESSIAFSMGLFPDKVYKIYDFNDPTNERDTNPPIMDHIKFNSDYFNLVIENKQNTLFHAKKCKFGESVPKIKKQYNYLTSEEKNIVYAFLISHFPDTLKKYDLNEFSDHVARSIYTSMRIVNKHYRKRYVVPQDLKNILTRVSMNYNFYVKVANDGASKIRSTSFFDHLIKLFENKIQKFENEKAKWTWNWLGNINFDFLNKILYGKKESVSNPLSDFLPTIENEDYSDLKLVTYSGHEGNLTGIVRNLLTDEQLKEYFDNFEKYKKLLYISFGATIDFKLIYDDETTFEFYVKIFLNGEEVFEKIRSHKEGEYLIYDSNLGIKYSDFKDLIDSRIFEDMHKCNFTK